MSPFKEQFDSHQIHQTLSDIRKGIENARAIVGTGDTEQKTAILDYVENALTLTETSINVISTQLLSIGILDRLFDTWYSIRDNLTNYTSNPNDFGYIDNVQNHLHSILNDHGNPLTIFVLAQNAQENILRKATQQISDTQSSISNLESKLEESVSNADEVNKKIDAGKKRMDDNIEDILVEGRNKINSTIENTKNETRKTLEHFSSEAAETVTGIKELYSIASDAIIGREYKEASEKLMESARKLQKVGSYFGIIAVLLVVIPAFIPIFGGNEDINKWQSILARIPASLMLVALSGYFLKIGLDKNKVAEKYLQISLISQVIDGFISTLPKEVRHQFKVTVGYGLYVLDESSEKQDVETKSATPVMTMLSTVTEKLGLND